MRKRFIYFFVLIICLFLVACQSINNANENEETNRSEEAMNQVDIFDFKHIQQAPETTEKHPIDKVIKVFFDESSIDQSYRALAIDIENDEIYQNPIIGRRGLRAQDSVTKVKNSQEVQDILKKYKVQDWESDDTLDDAETYEDSYSWRLWMQFEDGTVEKYSGTRTEKDQLTPDNFEDFAQALYQFEIDKLNVGID